MAEKNSLKKQLDAHIQEWEALKPTIERLSKSEQDLNFVIGELDKLSTLASTPNSQQLNEDNLFTPPEPKPQKIPPADTSPLIEFGIHLASYQQQKNLVNGWYLYQRQYQKLLQNKKPMVQLVNISGIQYHRLIVAPYGSLEQAVNACNAIKTQDKFCKPVMYNKF